MSLCILEILICPQKAVLASPLKTGEDKPGASMFFVYFFFTTLLNLQFCYASAEVYGAAVFIHAVTQGLPRKIT